MVAMAFFSFPLELALTLVPSRLLLFAFLSRDGSPFSSTPATGQSLSLLFFASVLEYVARPLLFGLLWWTLAWRLIARVDVALMAGSLIALAEKSLDSSLSIILIIWIK